MNILIIMADQHRMDCLGTYGNREISTPHLDQLGNDGVVFENSFCSAPVCTPSRYSFITGLYAHQHMGWANRSTIPAGLQTFPKLLREEGYQTKAVGKMHYTPTYLDVGFSEMELAEQNGAGRYEDDYHAHLMESGLYDRIDLMDQEKKYRDQAPEEYWDCFGAMESDLPEAFHSTTWIGEKGVQALQQWGEGNHLLMVSFIKPHHPFDPPVPWSRMYDPVALSLLPGWTEQSLDRDLCQHKGYFPHERLTEGKLKHIMSLYYASISQIDHYVGKMVEQLKQKGLYEDTLIVYTSDHGEYMGYHHLLLKNNYMYDPLVKVPLIIKFPLNRDAGTRRTDLVSNVDIAPTLLAAAGCAGGPHMIGEDLGKGTTKRSYVFAEHANGMQYMLRTATRKLIFHKKKECSLYLDLENDPYELDNVFGDDRYRSEIDWAIERLYSTVLFDAVTPTHVDRGALEITIKRRGIDKESSSRWFEERMNSFEKNNL